MKQILCALIAGGIGLSAGVQAHARFHPSLGGRLHARAVRTPGSEAPAPPSGELVTTYCVTCHNDRVKTGGLSLQGLDISKVGENALVLEKVARKLKANAMPPAGAPRPDKPTVAGFVSSLESALDYEARIHPNPGRPALHRLNRTEYANAIRDLLALDIDVATLLPADDSAFGFDNVADVLGVSPTLIDRYLSAAQKVSRAAIGNPNAKRTLATYRPPADLTQTEDIDGLPFGTRGGLSIRHQFPVDGDYVIKVKLGRTIHEMIRGLEDLHQLEISIDGERAQLFRVGGLRDNPETDPEHTTQNASDDKNPRQGHFRQSDFEVTVHVPAGPHEVIATFIKDGEAQLEDEFPAYVGLPVPGPQLRTPFLRSNIQYLQDQPPYIIRLFVEGPMSKAGVGVTPSRTRIFICAHSVAAEEATCARRITASLTRTAYRRPVTAADTDPLFKLYSAERAAGGSFEAGIETMVRGLLVKPNFLFRFESESVGVAPPAAYRLNDSDLASRLSFFLWSSIPDDELIDVAARGTLHEPAVLERQVRRMLADPKSHALMTNFPDQWLQLRNLQFAFPSTWQFPDFDDNLRQAMRRETQLFFESILREDRTAMDLLTANYTFVNERLARHYDIPRVLGTNFRRVTLPEDSPRRGLLGQGSFLTVTSQAARTSPVVRGKWVLENILGAPPPPPPPNVPDLKDNEANGKILSMRERMAQHRSSPVCASCHSRMDPIGLALEPFDLVGRLRTRSESNEPIDAAVTLADGSNVVGPAGLGRWLLGQEDMFVTVLTEKLLTYAIGRGLEYYDAPAVRKIVNDAASGRYKLSALVTGVINSPPFQMRAAADTTIDATSDRSLK